MKVIATSYQQERLIIDEVDAITASMTASVLNEMRARLFMSTGEGASTPPVNGSTPGWWFYSAQPDTYELKS